VCVCVCVRVCVRVCLFVGRRSRCAFAGRVSDRLVCHIQLSSILTTASYSLIYKIIVHIGM